MVCRYRKSDGLYQNCHQNNNTAVFGNHIYGPAQGYRIRFEAIISFGAVIVKDGDIISKAHKCLFPKCAFVLILRTARFILFNPLELYAAPDPKKDKEHKPETAHCQ